MSVIYKFISKQVFTLMTTDFWANGIFALYCAEMLYIVFL